jgi:hypothetical protein
MRATLLGRLHARDGALFDHLSARIRPPRRARDTEVARRPVAVSKPSDSDRRNTPRSRSTLAISMRWPKERPRRSSRQTTREEFVGRTRPINDDGRLGRSPNATECTKCIPLVHPVRRYCVPDYDKAGFRSSRGCCKKRKTILRTVR